MICFLSLVTISIHDFICFEEIDEKKSFEGFRGFFWRFWFLLWAFSDIMTCFGKII
jgi:hypothetical protein